MKTSFVIASVLLAGVALEAAAFRINNDENDSHKQWSRYQQVDSSEGSPITFQQNDDQFQITENRDKNNQKSNLNNNNNENLDQYNQKSNLNNNYNNNNNENRDQYNQQLNHNNQQLNHNNQQLNNNNQQLNNNNQQLNNNNNYNNNADNKNYKDDAEQQQQQLQQQGQSRTDQPAGLTKEIVEKIAAFQKIARDNDVAGRARYLDGALSLHQTSAKTGHGYVTFQDGTAKRLDAGRLQYLYINEARDAVLAQYRFDRVLAAGSFRSNARDARAGRYAVAMDDVSCNVTAAYDTAAVRRSDAAADARPARFRSADVVVNTDDGAETRAFDDAVTRDYLPALQKAVSAEVARSAAGGWPMIAQMKREMSAAVRGGGSAKLFDMSWKEDDVSMTVPDVGFQRPQTADAPPMRLASVAFYRESDDAYRMRYHVVLDGLRWSAPLTVQWAGKKTIDIRSVDFDVEQVDVFVTVDGKSDGQQQQQQQQQQLQQQQQKSCGKVNTNVEVTGLRYDFNENVQPEVAAKVQNKLQRFIEHALEKYVQESLKRELCHGNAQ